MNSSFSEDLEKAEKEYGVGSKGEYFTIQEGDNNIRILSKAIPLAQHFLGKNVKPAVCFGEDKGCPHHGEKNSPPGLKFATWIYDHKGKTISLIIQLLIT